MARIRLVALAFVVLGVAVPSGASPSQTTVGCAGAITSGGTASCVQTFRIPHFNAADAFDYETLVAHIVSPQAISWKVHGTISDAKGKTYFSWDCEARRSIVAANSSAYFDRTCSSWRRLAKDGTSYYVAKTSKPQVLKVTAWVGGCLPAGLSPCQFEAKATYLLS